MQRSVIRIGASAGYDDEPGEIPIDLKPLVLAATGKSVRRVGRFIQLALVGAGRCVTGSGMPSATAVYLASGRGDMEVTVEVMEELFRNGQPIRPLSFINTVSNSACFYIAKQLGIEGPSCFVSRSGASFQAALQLAMLDLRLGRARSALVGSVDIVLHPREVHRRRLHLPPGTPVGEGSHWLWLTTDLADGPELADVTFFKDEVALDRWLDRQGFDPRTTLVCRDRLRARAFYQTEAAAVIGDFLELPSDARTLVHINGDDEGRFAVMVVHR